MLDPSRVNPPSPIRIDYGRIQPVFAPTCKPTHGLPVWACRRPEPVSRLSFPNLKANPLSRRRSEHEEGCGTGVGPCGVDRHGLVLHARQEATHPHTGTFPHLDKTPGKTRWQNHSFMPAVKDIDTAHDLQYMPMDGQLDSEHIFSCVWTCISTPD